MMVIGEGVAVQYSRLLQCYTAHVIIILINGLLIRDVQPKS